MMRTSAAKRLAALIEQFEPEIARAFLAAIADISNRAIISEITRAIEDGDITRAIRSLGLTDSAFRSLTAKVEQAFEVGSIAVGGTFPKVLNTPNGKTVFRFDVRNSRAEAWLRDHSSTLVTRISEETRVIVRETIQQGLVDGRNPRNIALDLVGRVDRKTGQRVGGSVGLTPGQNRWVANTRRDLVSINDLIRQRAEALRNGNKNLAEKLLIKIENSPYFNRALRGAGADKVILKSAKDGVSLTSEMIEKLVTQYKSNALRYRGEVIGRTEAIASLNRSEWEAINQAVDMGAVKQSAVKRIWDSAGNDGRTRDSHLEIDGQTVDLNEPFTFPDGTKAMFPGDTSLGASPEETIQCRCVARTNIDWLAGARDVTTQAERDAILALSDEELFNGR